MESELEKRLNYGKLELSLLPDRQIAKSATIGEMEQLQKALKGDERADIIAEFGDVLWCINSWRLIEQRDSLKLPKKLKAWITWRSQCTRQQNPKQIPISNTLADIRSKNRKMRPKLNFRLGRNAV